MKRIYTKLVKSTLSLALLLSLGNVATAQCDIPAPEGAIWGTQFDGGLDGWEAFDGEFNERLDDDGNAIGWTWEADGNCSKGAFATDVAIPSPSVCNGAMVFDSDFLDNTGDGSFGTGLCPAPEGGFCEGVLRSPTIDLSETDATEFVLQFSTLQRNFLSNYSVLLSIDDGETWQDTFNVFPDGYVESMTNSPHNYNELQRIPLCGLGNERNVKIAFWYQGNYYYWAIDDVYIVGVDNADLRVNDNWFATSLNYGTPASQVAQIPFLADIENRSTITSPGSTLNVSVTKDDVEVYSADLVYPAIDGCTLDENRVFPEMYTPADPQPGDEYTVTYTITSDGGDAEPLNDTRAASFIYTDNEFVNVIPQSESGLTYADNRFGAETRYQSFGSGFYIANSPEADPIVLDMVTFGIESDGLNGDPLTSGTIEVSVYEWVDVDGDGEVDGDPANEKVKVGTVTVLTDVITDRREINVVPLDEDENLIELKENTQYIVLLHFNPFNGSNYYNIVYSQSELRREYFDLPTEFAFQQLSQPGDNLSARVGTLGAVDGVTHDDRDGARNFIAVSWGTALVNVSLMGDVAANDINENIGINVYPNPTTEIVFADVSLENTSEAVYVDIVDMAGKVVLTKNYFNVKSAKLAIDVQSLVDGAYIMNIRTDDGINTQKFTVHNAK